MAREILLKAKGLDNGQWIEGSYLFCKDSATVFFKNEHYILKFDGYGIEHHAIDKDTICQYTGMTDKNGNKIWENDILRGHRNPNDLAKVVLGDFDVINAEGLERIDNVIGWHTEVIPTDAISRLEPFCLSMPLTDFYIKLSEWEVIGNIFDNPELLGDGEV